MAEIEALAAKTALVVSDFGGMAELVTKRKDGWLFRVGDAKDLARVLTEVLKFPDRLGALPFDATQPLDMTEAAKEMEARYQELAEGASS